jgi:FkbH-like protein
VEQVWKRKDLLLTREDVFPLEVHWMRKSDSVRRILSTWNISADTTVFVDDSPAEVAEVQASFPELVCRVFPRNDAAAAWALLHELRDLFGKSSVSEEDSIRLRSIREAVVWRQESGGSGAPSDDFLRSAEARICFDSGRTDDARAFELVNKTNQFNLNGKRYTESEWHQVLEDPSAFLTTATYEDKYGTLGKVAALIGTIRGRTVDLKSWVMSCRAFSRRIEHQCIHHLFEESGADRIRFDLVATERNEPIQDFFRSLSASPLGGIVELTKEDFFAKMPQLFHRVEVSTHA